MASHLDFRRRLAWLSLPRSRRRAAALTLIGLATIGMVPDRTSVRSGAALYTRFARSFRPSITWRDRRPIGQLVLATTGAGWTHNPRGWLLDPTIDTSTEAGRASFRRTILAWADRSVAILKSLDAQGMITWDIEGEQYPQPTTYLCDPRVLSRVAPEMDAVADAYFAKFRAGGLRVGVCVRPQRLLVTGDGRAAQHWVANAARELIDKIAYAKRRWGATLFYVDSNGFPYLPMDADVLRRVLVVHPDVLLVPEHENTHSYAYAAPYREARRGAVGTSALTRLLQPAAFGVTYVADVDFGLHRAALIRAVAAGDILMTRAWYADPANEQVTHIYRAARTRR